MGDERGEMPQGDGGDVKAQDIRKAIGSISGESEHKVRSEEWRRKVDKMKAGTERTTQEIDKFAESASQKRATWEGEVAKATGTSEQVQVEQRPPNVDKAHMTNEELDEHIARIRHRGAANDVGPQEPDPKDTPL